MRLIIGISAAVFLIICCAVIYIAAHFIRVLTPQEVASWCTDSCPGVFIHSNHELNHDVIVYRGDDCTGSFNIPNKTKIGAHITYSVTTSHGPITGSEGKNITQVCDAVFIATH